MGCPEVEEFKRKYPHWFSIPGWFIPREPEAEVASDLDDWGAGDDPEHWIHVDRDLAAIDDGIGLAGVAPDGAYRIAQEEEPSFEEIGPDGETLSLEQQERTREYNSAYAQLATVDPTNPALGPFLEQQGHVPTEADVARLRAALAEARGQPAPLPPDPPAYALPPLPPGLAPPPQWPRGTLVGLAPGNIALIPENAGVTGQPWQVYESQAPGSMLNPAKGTGLAPALPYRNPETTGADYVKFDGYRERSDGTIEMIERKTSVGSADGNFLFPTLKDQLRRQSAALEQNFGHVGVIEVPTEALAEQTRALIKELGIENITARVEPLR